MLLLMHVRFVWQPRRPSSALRAGRFGAKFCAYVGEVDHLRGGFLCGHPANVIGKALEWSAEKDRALGGAEK